MPRKLLFTLTVILTAVCCLKVCAVNAVSAQSAVVIEKDSKRVLYNKDSQHRLPIASTTKIMTAIVALENEDLSAQIEISPAAAATEGSSMYLEAGEKMTLEELLYGLMLSSGNDAAVAIAEHFGGSESFAALMNKKAEELGIDNTHFTNPNGLPDDEHYSSAYDMAEITAYALNNPKFAEIVSTKTKKIEGGGKAYPRTLTNHNKLLSMCSGCIGVKTGFTKAAGRCLVSAAQRDGMTLICVTLNATDDWNDHCSLYDSLFKKYKLKNVLSQEEILGGIDVSDAEPSVIPFAASHDFKYPLADGEDCSVSAELSKPLKAPVKAGAECGMITIRLGESEICKIPAAVCGDAKKKPVLDKARKNFIYSFNRLCRSWIMLLQS